ncbi:hypothetical protein Hypma_016003 [Hypsizygus marmoreus]|uniref:Uncharacterized protein n=1 Tax=Hypsizygus marmoreus TaxID=39966 RepID=A0A369K7G6_HYPMA|nr:hypothetical protein Hypma_016003 [Hypsizygus marmoreus]
MACTTITSSRSILMHACLAYLSPEIQTFDAVLRDSCVRLTIPPTPSRLPIELLLLIREQLVPTIIIHLYQRSTKALARYETSLRNLLCEDCLAYNHEVYGPDLWEWQHFSGPCGCAGVIDRPRGTNSESSECWDHLEPKQHFADCATWLEFYLSFRSSHLTGCGNSLQAIWEVVRMVLRDHGCQIVDDLAPPISHIPSHFAAWTKVTVNARKPIVISTTSTPVADGSYHDFHSEPIVLHRAQRDLGLCFEYENGLEIWRAGTHPRPRLPSPKPSVTGTASPLQTHCTRMVKAFALFLGACITLPLTITTLVLTVLCSYIHPQPLRIM